MSNNRTTRTPAARPRARQSKPPQPSISFMGEKYRVADKIGVMPLMLFARAAEAGVSIGDSKGLAAFHAQLQDVIHEDDWPRFQEDMITKKVGMDELLQCARQAVEIVQTTMAKASRANGNGKVTPVEIE